MKSGNSWQDPELGKTAYRTGLLLAVEKVSLVSEFAELWGISRNTSLLNIYSVLNIHQVTPTTQSQEIETDHSHFRFGETGRKEV